MLTMSPILTLPNLDPLVRLCAPLFPGLSSGGVFWHPARPARHLDAWAKPGSWTLQVGKLKLVLDRPTG